LGCSISEFVISLAFSMKRTLLSAGLFALLFTLHIQTASAQGMKPIKFEEYDLPNGLHVILYPEHSAPTLSIRVYYHVGSKNEVSDRTGFAHFFEHLMFEATDHIPRETYAKGIEQTGGWLNAFTAQDKTVYEDNVPSNYLRMALWQESERMHTLHVDSIGVNTQRQVVKEERRNRYENQPYGSFYLKVMQTVFQGSKYEWTPIGDAQYIDQATIPEFQAFYKKYYVPNNATLVIAGDFESSDAKDAVTEYFGWIPKGTGTIERPKIELPVQTTERNVEVAEKLTPLPGIVYAWRTVEDGNKDAYALDLLTHILSSGNSSRLVKRLVDKDQIAAEVQAFPITNESGGMFATLAIAKPGVDPSKVRAAMDDEIQNVQKNGVTEEEYQKAMNQITKDLIQEGASVEQIAVKLAEEYTFFHDTARVNKELANYQAVSRADVQRVAAEYMTNARRSVITYTVPAATGGQ
jgi:zinc protease